MASGNRNKQRQKPINVMKRLSYLKILLHLNLVQYGKVYYMTPSYMLLASEVVWIEYRDSVRENIRKEMIRKTARKMNVIINLYNDPSPWVFWEMAKLWVWDRVFKLKFRIWIG